MNAAPLSALLLSLLFPRLCAAVDNDGDGIPAEWELFRGLSDGDAADALLDWDGDGLSAKGEYLTQGRPWGNYTVHRLQWTTLPGNLGPGDITNTEFIAANRPGEFVINFHTSTASRSFLWTPPGGPLESPELVEVPFLGTLFIPFNDHGQAAVTVSDGVEVRSLRDWNAGSVFVGTGKTYLDGTPVARGLANDGKVMFLTHAAVNGNDGATACGWRGSLPGLGSDLLFYEQRVGSPYGAVTDTGGEAWFMGSSYNAAGTAFTGTYAASLPAGGTLAAHTLPAGTFGYGFFAAAQGMAAGQVYHSATGTYKAVLLSGGTFQYVEGGAVGLDPFLFGLSDDGIVLGTDFAANPDQPFLWKAAASVVLSKARLELHANTVAAGLSAAGALYALDYGDFSTPPQPLAFRPAPAARGDGATEEAGSLTDADGDGIADVRQATAADTDGDGLSDLWELMAGRDATLAEVPPAPGSHTGLAVHTPQAHPLRRIPPL